MASLLDVFGVKKMKKKNEFTYKGKTYVIDFHFKDGMKFTEDDSDAKMSEDGNFLQM
jgi:hypothetical protein